MRRFVVATCLIALGCSHREAVEEPSPAVEQPSAPAADEDVGVETSGFEPKIEVRDRHLTTPDASTFAATLTEYQLEVDDKPLRLGSHRPDAMSSYAIFDHGGGPKWLDLNELTEQPHSGWTWVAAQLLPNGTVLAVLDWAVESSGPELHVVHYAGGVWRELAVLEKPHYFTVLDRLIVKSDDRWELSIELDDCGGCDVPVGAYSYITVDGGKSWTATGP